MTKEKHCNVHCGHFTGRGWDTGAATHGGSEVRCCHCGETAEIPYTVQSLPIPGHGPFSAYRQRVYTWPDPWASGEAPHD
ncbi:MAG: hypothetical protein AMXMBFR53_30170 [Gemmatimonadota bacterium]